VSKLPRHIYTFGYSGASLAQLTRLSQGLAATVIDTRYSRLTRSVDFSANRLGSALKERYVHVPEFGNLNYKNGGPIKLADPALGIRRISSITSQRSVILLCVCASWVECHRRDVAELLSKEFALPVRHLTEDDVMTDSAELGTGHVKGESR
jgi:uncharacterized protein (DUF488 family)